MAAKKKDAKPSKKKTVKKKATKRKAVKTKTIALQVERTLVGMEREISDAFQEIQCKSRTKVIRFILRLSANGGNQTQAALHAGFGNAKNVENMTDERKMFNAAAEATRLLKNPKIKKAYMLLCEDNDASEIVTERATREKIISILYGRSLHPLESSNAVRLNLELIAKLKGYMKEEDTGKTEGGTGGFTVLLPDMPDKNAEEKRKLQQQGYFEGEIIEGEVVESKGGE